MEKQEQELAGPSHRPAPAPAPDPDPAPQHPAPSPSAAGPSLKAQLEPTDARENDKQKLRSLLRELRQAAVCPPALAAKHILLTSKDCLPIFSLREACKGSSFSLFGTHGTIMRLVLEETGVIKPSLSKLKPSTLLERVKKEALRQEKKIQELQELASKIKVRDVDPSTIASVAEGLVLQKGRKRQRVPERDEVEIIEAPVTKEGAAAQPSSSKEGAAAQPSSSKHLTSLDNGAARQGNGIPSEAKNMSADEVDLDSILHELKRFEDRLGVSNSAAAKHSKAAANQGATLVAELKKLKYLLSMINDRQL